MYQKVIRAQKKMHWENFLDESKNIWQAAKYLSDNSCQARFSHISRLQTSDNSYVYEPEQISKVLLAKFFSSLLDYQFLPEPPRLPQLPMEDISEIEIKESIFGANLLKAPGFDKIPALV